MAELIPETSIEPTNTGKIKVLEELRYLRNCVAFLSDYQGQKYAIKYPTRNYSGYFETNETKLNKKYLPLLNTSENPVRHAGLLTLRKGCKEQMNSND